ncbi:MAG: hypothetical protein NTU99_04985 [Pseudanabaena sp. LacPavin_0818_WC45_MAG_42_6]|nr:hypothetical protein [Pseudanabaena sp. LacPavin_0818_WC45_MAG_42_6]
MAKDCPDFTLLVQNHHHLGKLKAIATTMSRELWAIASTIRFVKMNINLYN